RRVLAALIDIALMCGLFLVLAFTIGDAETGDSSFRVELEGWPAVAWIALVLLYYFVTEAAMSRTIGKALLGLRVSGSDGERAGTGPVAWRTVFRLIDALPLLYLLGFITILATGRRRQRIGDLVGRTHVIAA